MKDNREYVIPTVKKRIRKIDPYAKIVLFGSRARNEASSGSDWDFLVLTQLNVDRELKNKISDELFDTEMEVGEVLTSFVHNITKWETYNITPLYENIQKDGIVI